MRTKKTRRDLAALRAQATTPPVWIETPGWVLGNESPSVLFPYDDITGRLDHEALAALTKAAYLELARVELSAFIDPEASWLRLLLFRDHGEHAAGCRCSEACTAKLPPAPPTAPRPPVEPAGETYGQEGGTNRRSSLATWRESDRETEQQRLNRIANSVEPRWFT